METENNKGFIDRWEVQVRKGILDFIILSFLLKQEYYGYQLISEIKNFIEMNISEGTIYPLLNRLKKEGLITSRWVEMESGVPRKYYRITAAGATTLVKMKNSWLQLNQSLQKLMDQP